MKNKNSCLWRTSNKGGQRLFGELKAQLEGIKFLRNIDVNW